MKKLILSLLILFSFYCKGQSFQQMYINSIGRPYFKLPVVSNDTVCVTLLVTCGDFCLALQEGGYAIRKFEYGLDPTDQYGETIIPLPKIIGYLDADKKQFPPSFIIWQSK